MGLGMLWCLVGYISWKGIWYGVLVGYTFGNGIYVLSTHRSHYFNVNVYIK